MRSSRSSAAPRSLSGHFLSAAEQKKAAEEKAAAEKKAHEEAIKPPVTLNKLTIEPDIIGQPLVSLSMTNNSQKDIDAYKVQISAYDNYGSKLKEFDIGKDHFNGISQDSLPAGATTSDGRRWEMTGFDKGRRFVLRLMSIHFTDGTEWKTEDNQEVTIEGKFNP